jgi:hypothetical protein
MAAFTVSSNTRPEPPALNLPAEPPFAAVGFDRVGFEPALAGAPLTHSPPGFIEPLRI